MQRSIEKQRSELRRERDEVEVRHLVLAAGISAAEAQNDLAAYAAGILGVELGSLSCRVEWPEVVVDGESVSGSPGSAITIVKLFDGDDLIGYGTGDDISVAAVACIEEAYEYRHGDSGLSTPLAA